MLQHLARLALAAPRRIVAIAGMLTAGAAIFAAPVASSLSAGGFEDPASGSARATRLLTDVFHKGAMQLVLTVADSRGIDSSDVRTASRRIVEKLERGPGVSGVVSPWTSPPQAAAMSKALSSSDHRVGLIVADFTGGETQASQHAQAMVDSIDADILPGFPGVTVTPGGPAMVYAQITRQTQRDVLLMESIAVPLSMLVLVWVFGGLRAAMLPLAAAGVSIAGSLAVLRLIAMWTDVSIFALNLTAALGLALAIDYTLLIINRYRDEVTAGSNRDQALVTTMTTAGRTILFSALTVALSMATMVLFPIPFLRSFAYGGIATVVLCAVAAIVLTPAGIALLGNRPDEQEGRHRLRDVPGDPAVGRHRFWYRWTTFMIRHAIAVGLAGSILLISLGIPFLRVNWGFPDDRVLPSSASAHQVGDRLRSEFSGQSGSDVIVVVPDARGLAPADWDRFAAEASRVSDVSAVYAPTATFVDGRTVGPPTGGAGVAGSSAYLTVSSVAPLFSAASEAQLGGLRALQGPGGRVVLMTGAAAINRDSLGAITSRLPLVLGVIAGITFVVLFVLTGSVVLPVKALLLNTLSLTASFGALVWIFQDGHLGALGTTATGTLVVNIPVLLFCIAFGLSMDYEVFLLARIREFWLAGAPTAAGSDESVALGLAHTGRVVTAAALIMSISFAGLIAAQVSFMRMFGLGLALAVLVDATLVRMVLLPAFMHLLGRWNWWAPKPLAALHQRLGMSDVDHSQ
ncbi:MAG: MMPL family transporter [Mycobacterium sp.]